MESVSIPPVLWGSTHLSLDTLGFSPLPPPQLQEEPGKEGRVLCTLEPWAAQGTRQVAASPPAWQKDIWCSAVRPQMHNKQARPVIFAPGHSAIVFISTSHRTIRAVFCNTAPSKTLYKHQPPLALPLPPLSPICPREWVGFARTWTHP